MTTGIVYYTRNKVREDIFTACQKQIEKTGLPIVSVSSEPISLGKNIVVDFSDKYTAMFQKIVVGLENSTADYIFFCEDDVLYHESHFDFAPDEPMAYYYNRNVWRVRASDGHAIHYDTHQSNMLSGYKDFLLAHYRRRLEKIGMYGFSMRMGFEPGANRRKERVDDYRAVFYDSTHPCLDIRHETNLTASRWSQEDFRDKRNCEGWREAEELPGWGRMKNNFPAILDAV